MDGILNINKLRGKTSFGAVAAVRRLSGEQRVGHAGTLDPEATGVLLVCLGKATRIVEFLMSNTKTYRAEIELGLTTDTYDAAGSVIHEKDTSKIEWQQVEMALDSFRGRILQIPPMYSAIKYNGQPLYKLARAGKTVKRKARLIEVHSLDLVDWRTPIATVEVVCGKGTYIRSLAHDLGQALGCGAILRSLTRLRCGQFSIDDSVTLPELEDAFYHGHWHKYLYSIDSVYQHWKSVIVNDDMAQAIKNGQAVEINSESCNDGESLLNDSRCCVYSIDGSLLALMHFEPEIGQWRPDKVFQ